MDIVDMGRLNNIAIAESPIQGNYSTCWLFFRRAVPKPCIHSPFRVVQLCLHLDPQIPLQQVFHKRAKATFSLYLFPRHHVVRSADTTSAITPPCRGLPDCASGSWLLAGKRSSRNCLISEPHLARVVRRLGPDTPNESIARPPGHDLQLPLEGLVMDMNIARPARAAHAYMHPGTATWSGSSCPMDQLPNLEER